MSQRSFVIISRRLQAGRPGFDSRKGEGIFRGPPTPLSNVYQGFSSRGKVARAWNSLLTTI